MEIVVDTESTGLTRLSFANKLNFKQWPRMVQIAWAIVGDGAIIDRQSLLIQPADYAIPAGATQIHGISQQHAIKHGVPIDAALHELNEAFAQCERIIAHNINFDIGIIESEALRQNIRVIIPARRICTVHLGREYLRQVKGIKRGGYPKLSHLYEALLGFSFSGQHDAASDVTACFHVYRKLKKLGFQ